MQNSTFRNKLKRLSKFILLLFISLIVFIAASIPFAKYIVPNDLISADTSSFLTIDNVNIITMAKNSKDKLLPNRQIVIEQGIIKEINSAGTPPAVGSHLIDGNSAYVVPGLFDMHVHLYERKYLALNLAYGITSVRAMNGQDENLRWKKELENNEWLGSNLYISSPILDGINTNALNQAVSSANEGREQVRKAKLKGFDFIKAYGYLDNESFAAITDEANKVGLKVAKHGPHPIKGSEWDSLAGLQSLEHVEDIFQGPLNYKFDHEKLKNVVEKIKNLHVPVVPTLEAFDHLTQLSKNKQKFIDSLDLDYLNPLYFHIMQKFTVERWLNATDRQIEYLIKENEFLLNITYSLHKAGVKLLVGSDAGTNHTIPGIATHNEMRLLKKAGLSNYEVLEAATINAATALDIGDRFGSIKVGFVADMIVVKSNPLDDVSQLKEPFAVVKNGQWLSESVLEKLKQSAKNNQSYYWSLIKLLSELINRSF